jgi:hypothetical protein
MYLDGGFVPGLGRHRGGGRGHHRGHRGGHGFRGGRGYGYGGTTFVYGDEAPCVDYYGRYIPCPVYPIPFDGIDSGISMTQVALVGALAGAAYFLLKKR